MKHYTTFHRWVMANKWRRWGMVAIICFALNYLLLMAGIIEANEFEIITNALIAFLRFFLLV
jgi:hypothetical protein